MQSLSILITGGTAGFGLQFTRHALEKGHKVIAAARNVAKAQQLHPDVEAQGGIWLELDLTHSDIREKVSQAVSDHNVDVIINNAGYGYVTVLEDATISGTGTQFRTNVFGPVQVIQGALPHFRARKSGIILNVSSLVGLQPLPGATIYSASKGALDALTQALVPELAPFGIKVLSVAPGSFRTRAQSSESAVVVRYNPDYKGTPGASFVDYLRHTEDKQPGDPDKGVARMLEFIVGEGLGGKATDSGILYIGKDIKDAMKHATDTVHNAWNASEEAAMSCDFDE